MTNFIIEFALLSISIFIWKQILELKNNIEYLKSSQIESLKKYDDNISNKLSSRFYGYNTQLKELNSIIDNLKSEIEALKSKNNDLEKISDYFSLAKPIGSKDNRKYFSSARNILDNYNKMSHREFIDLYSKYKVLSVSNFDDIRANSSIPADFTETDLGECIAIPLDESIYSIFIKKGLELKDLAFQASGISFIYELSEEPLIGFSYSDWEITKLPMFQKLSNNKWVCLEKGYLKLNKNLQNKEINQEKITNITQDKESTKKEDLKEDKVNTSLISEIKTFMGFDNSKSLLDIASSYITNKKNDADISDHNDDNNQISLINNFKKLDNMSFIKKYNCQFFDVENLVDSFLYGKEVKFFRSNGKYLFVNDFSVKNRYYLFYKKGEVICKNSLMKQIFEFSKKSKDNMDYINWEIIRPAIVEEKEGKYIVTNKGFLNVNR